jgi:membrane protease subunit HflK
VQAAVDDAQKARNDSERYVLQADAYARDIVPKARGDAARVLEDAQAYRERVIADAEGDASRFEALLTEYQKAPRVTRDRLYIEAIEEVYSKTNKVILDSEGSGNLLYLPIDKMLENRGAMYQRAPGEGTRSADSRTPNTQSDVRSENDENRERRTRQ